jgi:hypothetical protein
VFVSEAMTGVPVREIAADKHYAKNDYRGFGEVIDSRNNQFRTSRL